MSMYRLKPEAVPFFAEKLATQILDLSTWKQYNVDLNALEEIKPPYLSYGHWSTETSKTLGGWSERDGKHFEFTIHFPGVKLAEHDKFSNGKITRELMEKIQYQIDRFYQQFANGEDDGGES